MKVFRRLNVVFLCACLYLSVGVRADTNLTDLWWNPNESGWGVTFTQEWNGPVFAAIYGYDGAGKATWLVSSMNALPDLSIDDIGRSYEGQLYETSGGAALTTQTFNPPSVTTTPVGTMKFVSGAEYKGTLTYTYKGTTVTKQIERYTVSALTDPGATSTGSPYLAVSQTVSNGQCSSDFPENTRTNFSFRMEVNADGTAWKLGQCDAGSTATCSVFSPFCTFTPKANKRKQYGSVLSTEGNLNCNVGGSSNPLTGGKSGGFSAEFYDMRRDDAGYSGKLQVTDGSACKTVSSFMIKSGAWITSCSFTAGALSCTQ